MIEINGIPTNHSADNGPQDIRTPCNRPSKIKSFVKVLRLSLFGGEQMVLCGGQKASSRIFDRITRGPSRSRGEMLVGRKSTH